MGQKVNPIGFRIGITEDWRSRWYAPKASYGEFLVEDYRIRAYIDQRLNRQPPYAAVAKIEIERTRDAVKVILHTARPGLVIGPKGAEVDKLKEHLENLIDRKITVNIMEIKNPDLDADATLRLAGQAIERLGRMVGAHSVYLFRWRTSLFEIGIVQEWLKDPQSEVLSASARSELGTLVRCHLTRHCS